MDTPQNKVILSGLKPSGDIHLGNYLGALKQWVQLQEGNTAYFCIVDLHAITVSYKPKELSRRVLDAAAMYIALGIDPQTSVMFVQSHVPAHTELAWLLGTIIPYAELTHMTQFKDKYMVKKQSVSQGLFTYPVLMAADIVLYQTHLVPVGEDQMQHLELTQNIAERFNTEFGDTFRIPTGFLNPSSARIMSLQDPTRKMSKSESEKGCIALTDTPDVIQQKIMSAVTETEAVFSFTDSGPAVKNLLAIYKTLSGESEETIEHTFTGQGYKKFKEALAELVIEHLRPIQDKYKKVRADEDEMR
ncbi:MAG: tryptophan--tRNA ligase, partial [Acidobacteriota bacterium]